MQHQLRGRVSPTPVRRCPALEALAAAVSVGLGQEASPWGGQAKAGQDNQHEGPGAGRFHFAT